MLQSSLSAGTTPCQGGEESHDTENHKDNKCSSHTAQELCRVLRGDRAVPDKQLQDQGGDPHAHHLAC